MPLYDADNRLTADTCAVQMRDNGNASIASYTLTNLRAAHSSDPLSVAAEHRNLWSWDGYGFNPAAVDGDSQLRVRSEVTHPRSKIQLPTRVFGAAPDLSHGQADPEMEMRVVGTRTTVRPSSCPSKSDMAGGCGGRVCDRLAERAWDRFVPGMRPVSVRHIVPPWVNGGAPSRDIARSDQFLQNLGYVNDGRIWRRATGYTNR
jgi:hypothetical protein